jgi:predicted phosphohydrolase
MKIQVVSDLHLEFGAIVIENAGADVLILSGDVCVADDLDRNIPGYDPLDTEIISKFGARQKAAIRYLEFFKQVSEAFPHVIYIAGNHEFYQGKWVKSLEILRETVAKFPNIHFLENDIFKLDDVTFIGGTLWTDMNNYDPLTLHATKDLMQDYNLIRNDELGFTKLKPATTVLRHKKTLEYISLIVEGKHNEKFVVVGHHAPSRMSIHEHYKDQYLMNGAYASDLSEFILDRPQIKLWTAGHMHHSYRYYIGDTLIAANPRGYVGEVRTGLFNSSKIIDLDNMPNPENVKTDYDWLKS